MGEDTPCDDGRLNTTHTRIPEPGGSVRGRVWLGYHLFTTGFSAKTEPHALEVLLARQIRHLAIRSKHTRRIRSR
jgi:hypothetical protein